MAKKCPNCNSSKTQKHYETTDYAGDWKGIAQRGSSRTLWGYHCSNCGNYFK